MENIANGGIGKSKKQNFKNEECYYNLRHISIVLFAQQQQKEQIINSRKAFT